MAIGLQKEEKEFFYVDPNTKSYLHDLPEYFDQLNSFNKDHLVNHLITELTIILFVQKFRLKRFRQF